MIDTDRLEKLAREATRGPWHVDYKAPGGGNVQSASGPVADARWFGNTHKEAVVDYANAAYIAAASPDVILALLSEREAMRKALEEIASDEIHGPPGISIYAAAANELPRRQKIARQALSSMKGQDHG